MFLSAQAFLKGLNSTTRSPEPMMIRKMVAEKEMDKLVPVKLNLMLVYIVVQLGLLVLRLIPVVPSAILDIKAAMVAERVSIDRKKQVMIIFLQRDFIYDCYIINMYNPLFNSGSGE